jgi:hypothetical protein
VLIALLAVLGVDLIVLVGLVAALLLRRRWLGRHGAVPCRLRAVEGGVEGVGVKWKSGRARWVRDVLVFSPAPLLLTSRVVPVDGVAGEPRAAAGDEGQRLGEGAVVVRLVAGDAALELCVPAEARLPALPVRPAPAR